MYFQAAPDSRLQQKNERKPVKIQFRIPDPSLDITGIKGEVRKED